MPQFELNQAHSPSDHFVSIPPPLAQIPSGLPSHVAPLLLSQPSIPSGGRPSPVGLQSSQSHDSIPSGHLRRAFLSRSNAFLPRRLSPPSSPPHASIPSGHLPRAFLSRSNAFLSRRLSPPSSPHGSLSGRLSPPSSPPHASLSGRLSPPSSPPHASLSGRLAPPSSPPHSSLSGRLSPPSLPPHAPIPSGGELLPPSSSSIAFGSSKSMLFGYEELKRATDGFSDAKLLGQGGFGSVHKGILRNGKEVAVKQLKAGSSQGEREFKAEVEIISRVHHKHLVSLVGYCSTGYEMLLAYEFVPNKTLEFHLHGKAPTILDWSARQLIAVGSAKGLAYLHEDCHPRIIHRDIKAANILLDFMFEAKVADFGLAKDAPGSSTHVSTQVKGTFGYLDPEYAGSGQLTDKSDVFSYGVVLLELLTGRLPVDKAGTYHVSLVEWARPFLMHALKGKNSRPFLNLVDPRLQNVFDRDEMTRMVACAEACTRQSAKDRPKMSQVARVLEGAVSIANLNPGVTRGPSRGYSRDYNSQQENMTKLKLKKIASDIKGKLKWK